MSPQPDAKPPGPSASSRSRFGLFAPDSIDESQAEDANGAPETDDLALRCPECDYNLTGAPGDRCPWCGWSIDVDALLASESAPRRVQRAAAAFTAAVVGIGSIVVVYVLLSRSRVLSIYDGVTVASVFIAAIGHLSLSTLAVTTRARWPLPQREAGNILRFVGWLSFVGAVIGASHVLHVGPQHGFQGVAVSGVLQFILMALLFSIPAWSLLVLRYVSFRGPHNPVTTGRGRKDESEIDGIPGRAPFAVETYGPYAPEQIVLRWTDAPRPTTSSIEEAISRVWEAEAALALECGNNIVDAALVRLFGLRATPGLLELELGKTTFREFLGTNVHNALLVYGANKSCFADPLSIGALLITADGHLALQRCSHRVYPNDGLLHPFCGVVELPEDAGPAAFVHDDRSGPFASDGVFSAALRQLQDALGLTDAHPAEWIVSGVVRDRNIYQPELLVNIPIKLRRSLLREHLSSLKSADSIERGKAKQIKEGPGTPQLLHPPMKNPVRQAAPYASMKDPVQQAARCASYRRARCGIEFVHDDPDAVTAFLLERTHVSPVAQAALLLHGRHQWGSTWYEQACFVLYGQLPP